MRTLFSYVCCMSLMCWSPCGYGQQETSWQEEQSCDGTLPVARHEAAFVEVNDKFYLAGGRRIQEVSIYDPIQQSWASGAKPPLELHHFQPVVWEDEIWVGGAFTGRYPAETPVSHFYIYNPANDSWRRGPEIPEARRRGSAGVAIYKGRIYLVSGLTDGHRSGHQTWLDAYDPKTDTWEILPDAPRARDHFHATAAAGKLYVLGGRRSKAPKNTFGETEAKVDVFDFKTQTWTTLEDSLPTPRAGTFNALWQDHVLVIGGESNAQKLAHSEVEGLNVKTHMFGLFPPLPEGRHGAGAACWRGGVYVASGNATKGGGAELTSQYRLKPPTKKGFWQRIKGLFGGES